MKNHTIQKIIYELVSNLFVFPIYKVLFKGHLIGRDNIPQKDSFIMVSNHGSLLDPPLFCLLYTSPSPRDRTRSRMPSSA